MAYIYGENDFKKLDSLKSSKLGIMTKSGDTAMSSTSRNVVIGLGGMGLATVTRLKRELRERVGIIDDTKIRFLAIDTSKDDLNLQRNDSLFKADEELPLFDNSAVTEMLRQDPKYRPSAVNAMIPEGFCPELSGDGANQVRMAGRLSLMEISMFQNIYAAIKNAISKLTDFTQMTLDVHIVAGIGGGTGSGLVVDIPYMVRKIAKDLGVSDRRVRVMGHVYLPNVYDNGGTANLECAYRNGYAALKEIDYLMNIEQIGETYDAEYPQPFGQCSWAKNIFDQCTLVGGQSAGDVIEANPKMAAVAVCVDNLINQVTRITNSDSSNADASISDFFTSNAFYTNVGTALNATLHDPSINFPQNGNYKYQIIGSSSIKFPNDLIVEDFVGSVFSKGADVLRANAARITKEDVDAFERGVCEPAYILFNASNRVKEAIANYLNSDQHTWNKDTVKQSTFDVNIQGIIRKALDEFDRDGKLIMSAMSVINDKAEKIFADPQKGPYYLGRLLKANTKEGAPVAGYFERLDNYTASLNNYANQLKGSIGTLNQNRESIRQNMTEGLFSKVNKYLDEYKKAVTDLYEAKFKIELCDRLSKNYYMGNDINSVVYKMKSNFNDNFLAYIDVFEAIADISIENSKEAKRALLPPEGQLPPKSSIYSLTDPIFNKLKDAVASTVDTEIKRLGDDGVSAFIGALTREIMENKDSWNIGLERSACADRFRSFINSYKPFDVVTQRSMADYLDQAYGLDPQNVKAKVVSTLVDHINALAEPMCNVWENISWPQLDRLCYRYLVIPSTFSGNADSVWGPLFDASFGKNNMSRSIFRSSDKNAIYSYTMFACMPSWIHGSIVKYEKAYYNYSEPGMHINENDAYKIDLKRLPAIMVPNQWFRAKEGVIDYKNDNELKIYDDIAKKFAKAQEYGIVAKNTTGEYVVYFTENKPDDEAVATFIDKFCQDPENKKAGILDEKLLYPRFAEKFGAQMAQVIASRTVRPNTDENAVELIRHEMSVLSKLEGELNFFEEKVAANPVLKAILLRVKLMPKIRELSKYMIYGLIAPNEIGVWAYTLGENTFKITNRAEVNNSENPWQSKYMEMAVCEKFPELEKYAAHQPLLEKKVEAMNEKIYNGSMETFTEIKTIYTNLVKKSEGYLMAIDEKRNNGDILNFTEESIEWFYKYFVQCLGEFIEVFTA